jgi:tryptophan halogenase
MTGRVKQVTIVGGGTAGWLTALILQRFLNGGDSAPVGLTLIESPSVPTVGVGEATIQTIANLLQQLDLDEGEFFARCNASFKLSVRLDGWSTDKHGRPVTFYHPFNIPPSLGGYSAAYHFQQFGHHGADQSIADAVVPNLGLIKAGKGPRSLTAPNYDRTIAYSYHLDAGLFAAYLREVAISRGVTHIKDDVVNVEKAKDGSIRALQLKNQGLHPIELVVDCTGFAGLLIKKALNEPFIPLGDRLLNDRALPVQIPHSNAAQIEPCTRSSALEAGWVWRVPLYSRVGTGYVYSSAFRSDDEARKEFFDYLRATGDLPANTPEPDTRVIQIQIGRSRAAWVKNCVAIGLSAGFVEPLESTGIYMIEAAARWLAGHFPSDPCDPILARSFNQLSASLYEEAVDFIQLHYWTSNRSEPYWRAARSTKISDWLGHMLELWKHRLPENVDTRDRLLFKYWSYIFVLQPKGFFDGVSYPLALSLRREHWNSFSNQLRQHNEHVIPRMPSHYRLVEEMRRRAPSGNSKLMRAIDLAVAR